MTDHVIFGGFQPDTAAMMAAFDLYVAASVQETFGLSILEAMASGLPVIYTVCPALDGIQTSQARQVPGTRRGHAGGNPQGCGRGTAAARSRQRGLRPLRHGVGCAQVDDLYERILADRLDLLEGGGAASE